MEIQNIINLLSKITSLKDFGKYLHQILFYILWFIEK